MSDEALLSNPFWHALQTEHRGFALAYGRASRYPADVLPFAGTEKATSEALGDLCELMAPGETLYVRDCGEASCGGLLTDARLPCWQMHFPQGAAVAEGADAGSIQKLSEQDTAAMVGLTDIAFPGFFRSRTPQLGRYFGVFAGDTLVAMAGERMAVPGWREISAVCTHPAHTGQGLAQRLIQHLLAVHASEGLRSMLHVLQANRRAISLYQHLGFGVERELVLACLRRV